MKIFFEDAFEKIARIVTQQTGVQVRFEGMQPCTDGKVIVLPKLSKLPEDFNKDLLNGYLDHEAAHVIFTDMNVFKAELARDKFLKTVSNALEDIRIERKMGERFIGCKQNIRQMNDFHVSDIKKNFDKINPATQIAFAISLYGSGDAEPADFKGNARAALEIVKDDIDELPKCQNTGDVIELAKRIVAKLRDSAQQSEDGEGADIGDGQPKKDDKKDKKQQKKNQKGKGGKNQKGEEEQDEKDDGEDGEDGKGSKGKKDKKKSKSKDGNEPEDKADDDEGDQGGDSDDQDGQDDEDDVSDGAEGDDAGSDESDEGDDEGDESGSGSREGEGEEEENSDLSSVNFDDVEEDQLDAAAKIADQLKSAAEDSTQENAKARFRGYAYAPKDRRHIPFSTKYDQEIDNTRATGASSIRRDVESIVSPCVNALMFAIKAEEKKHYIPSRERGRLSARDLYKVAHGVSNRVFRGEVHRVSDSVAASLLIDLSGSMRHGSKLKCAMLAGMAYSEVLTRIGIVHEALGFTAQGDAGIRSAWGSAGSPGHYNRRTERLDHYIFKRFDQSDNSGVANVIKADSGNNCDPESLMWAARRLGQREEKRKILFVFSDGEPATEGDNGVLQNELKLTIEELERAGIEVIGIGIQSAAVKRYYPKSVVVDTPADLMKVTVKEVQRMLMPEGRRMRTVKVS